MMFAFALSNLDSDVRVILLEMESTNYHFLDVEDVRMQFLDKLNYVEQELAATKGRESALQERLLKELGDYQERYRGQVKKINELEVIFVPWTYFFSCGGKSTFDT